VAGTGCERKRKRERRRRRVSGREGMREEEN
jgi:hypothetical protein